MVSPVGLREAKNSRFRSVGLPGPSLAASLVAGLVLACQPDYDGAHTSLDPREVVIDARSPGVYLATLTTSFRPDDGPRGQEYYISASDITPVSMSGTNGPWLDEALVRATITLIELDGSDGVSFVETWSLASLAGEEDTGETAPPHVYLSLWGDDSLPGSTARVIDVRIEFETDAPGAVRLRWQPMGYVRMFRIGCIGTDGWVDLVVEAQAGTSDQVVEAGDTG